MVRVAACCVQLVEKRKVDVSSRDFARGSNEFSIGVALHVTRLYIYYCKSSSKIMWRSSLFSGGDFRLVQLTFSPHRAYSSPDLLPNSQSLFPRILPPLPLTTLACSLQTTDIL